MPATAVSSLASTSPFSMVLEIVMAFSVTGMVLPVTVKFVAETVHGKTTELVTAITTAIKPDNTFLSFMLISS